MQNMITFIKYLLYCIPFLLLCFAAGKINLRRTKRGRQFLMPFISLLYCFLIVIFAEKINILTGIIFDFLESHQSFLNLSGVRPYVNYFFNVIVVLAFLILKSVCLPIISVIWKNNSLMEHTSGYFYSYHDDISTWTVKNEYGLVKKYLKGFYYAAMTVSTFLFATSQMYHNSSVFNSFFVPVLGIIVIGEVINYFSGITKKEFVEDILGEDEEAFKVANYGLLRNVLKNLFPSRVLSDNTINNNYFAENDFRTLEEMKKSGDKNLQTLANYFKILKEAGERVDINYVKSTINLIEGKSTLFCNPFYRDLTNYVMVAMMKQLMKYKNILIISGRESTTEDVKEWIDEGMHNLTNSNLWNTEILTNNPINAEIGIMQFSDVYNIEFHEYNNEFLKKVGFVLLIEPSRILATGQLGLKLIIERLGEEVVFCASDRNCDGLVDALSHILKTNITEVTATVQTDANTSYMAWKADGSYMHHKILGNISRYLGVGTELNSVALKYQIQNTKWFSSDKFPVIDMKWIAGQYYRNICQYANLPLSQAAFNRDFQVSANIWECDKEENQYITAEDEFNNIFEMIRVFSSRATQQGFVNVISEEYLLRDYMVENVQTFIDDPKAVPTITPDFARTERNTVLKLIIKLSVCIMSEEELEKEFMLSGIDYDDVQISLQELITKHCGIENPILKIHFREELLEDGIHSKVNKYFGIEKNSELAEYSRGLRNAYYIAEDEQGKKNYISSKLYGHVFQTLLPRQFITFAGKYYQVETITPQNGVVLRRAADHISNRKYYRQIRTITLSQWCPDKSMAGTRSISGIRIEKGFCNIDVSTSGYLEMNSYKDLKKSKEVKLSAIPNRRYQNKLVLKIFLPESEETIRYTICMMLNEIFKTTYPESYQYVCATLKMKQEVPDELKNLVYSLDGECDDSCIYIVEDSEIDLGLVVSIDRNLNRYFEMIYEMLSWHTEKMMEQPKTDEEDTDFVPEFEPVQEEKKKECFLKRFFKKMKKIFKRNSREEQEDVPEKEKTNLEGEQETNAPEKENTDLEEGQETNAPEKENTDLEEEQGKKSTEPEQENNTSQNTTADNENESINLSNESINLSSESINLSSESDSFEDKFEELDIEGEDDEIVNSPQSEQICNKTEYQENCFLKFGFDEINDFFAIDETLCYLKQYGYHNSPLSQARSGKELAEAYEKEYNPKKPGAHFCDFCGIELAGEYDVLADGRERCNHCSSTALKTGKEFKEVFKTVVRNMEIFFGIKINVAIKVRMVNAKKIAKHYGGEFVATSGFDVRTLGFAQDDKTGYSLFIENGSPKLAAISTIAHELTHIWQYQNWNRKEIINKYGKENQLYVYEGMAKWVEVQYMLFLNEIEQAKREEIVTALREDAYGKGFLVYRKKYPFSYGTSKKKTPFDYNLPL